MLLSLFIKYLTVRRGKWLNINIHKAKCFHHTLFLSYLQSLYIIISNLYIEKESEELYYNFCILNLINIILRMFTIYPMTTGAHSQH